MKVMMMQILTGIRSALQMIMISHQMSMTGTMLQKIQGISSMSLEVVMIIDIQRPHTMMIIITKMMKEKENKITDLHHIGAIKGAMKGLKNRHMKVQRKDLLNGAAPFVLNGLHQKMVYGIIPVTSTIETLNQV